MDEPQDEPCAEEKKGIVIKEAMNIPFFWLILSTATLTVFGSRSTPASSASYFIEIGFTVERAAQLASFNLGMLAAGKVINGFLCDKLSAKLSSVFSALVFGL